MTGRLALIVGGLLLAFLLIISPAGAGDQGCSGECPASVTGQALNRTPENPSLARRGCCSHHKGVCGCVKGRVKCCDGSLSPTCTCLRDDHEGVVF